MAVKMFPILALVFFLCLSGFSAAAIIAARRRGPSVLDESPHHKQADWRWFRNQNV
jgi:hypothetical protein